MTAKRQYNYHRSPPLPLARQQDVSWPVNAFLYDSRADPSPGDPDAIHRTELSRRTANRATKVMFFLSVLVVVSITMTACRASAQVIPILRLPLRISAFGTFTDAKPSFRYWGDRAVWGYTLGGIVQLPRIGGVELRGSMLRHGGISHQESMLVGPRASLHILHMSPYGSFLVGEGNSSWWSNPPKKGRPEPYRIEDHAFQWTVASGVDIHLHNRITFRLGELTYSKLYEPGKTLTPLTASSGFVIRLR
jgi:hypothetical protein